MDAAAIIAQARIKVDDIADPPLVADAQYLIWVDEAVQEAARRSRAVIDGSLTVSVVAGTATYNLPSGIIFVRRAKLALESIPLNPESYLDLDEEVSGWETETGTPLAFVTDRATGKLTLYPEPIVNDTLNLVCIVEPAAITLTTDTPQLPARFHHGLVDWLAYRYYEISDSDLENKEQALYHYALFEREFGKRSSAQDEIFQLRSRLFNNFDGTY